MMFEAAQRVERRRFKTIGTFYALQNKRLGLIYEG
jgi:hypothetical protein